MPGIERPSTSTEVSAIVDDIDEGTKPENDDLNARETHKIVDEEEEGRQKAPEKRRDLEPVKEVTQELLEAEARTELSIDQDQKEAIEKDAQRETANEMPEAT